MSDRLLTDAELDAIEKRVNTATAGPWKSDDGGPYGAVTAKCTCPDGKCNRCAGYSGFLIGESILPSNRPFIAESREDVPAMIDALREARAVILARLGSPESLRDVIRGQYGDESDSEAVEDCRRALRALGIDPGTEGKDESE
jgi:hypothetical protein